MNKEFVFSLIAACFLSGTSATLKSKVKATNGTSQSPDQIDFFKKDQNKKNPDYLSKVSAKAAETGPSKEFLKEFNKQTKGFSPPKPPKNLLRELEEKFDGSDETDVLKSRSVPFLLPFGTRSGSQTFLCSLPWLCPGTIRMEALRWVRVGKPVTIHFPRAATRTFIHRVRPPQSHVESPVLSSIASRTAHRRTKTQRERESFPNRRTSRAAQSNLTVTSEVQILPSES